MKQPYLVILLLVMNGCSMMPADRTGQSGTGKGEAECHMVFDAGSSSTRLYVYELQGADWNRYTGPTADALSYPVLGKGGKTMADIDAVVDSIVSAPGRFSADGPLGDDGLPAWSGFDWPRRCRLETVAVYATGGMRMAEAHDPAASKLIWQRLHAGLAERFDTVVETRTLSGFEEGLFAWLAVSLQQSDKNYGIVEMGGASVQLTFPCAGCKQAVPVRLGNRPVPIFSYSFQDQGQDEAWLAYGQRPTCRHGAGRGDPGWNEVACVGDIDIFESVEVQFRESIDAASVDRWVLTGAFRFMQDSDVENYCRNDVDSGFQPESSCFRALYQRHILRGLGVPGRAAKTDADWTLGALICSTTRCLGSNTGS